MTSIILIFMALQITDAVPTAADAAVPTAADAASPARSIASANVQIVAAAEISEKSDFEGYQVQCRKTPLPDSTGALQPAIIYDFQ